jgi:hypothetical protein
VALGICQIRKQSLDFPDFLLDFRQALRGALPQ